MKTKKKTRKKATDPHVLTLRPNKEEWADIEALKKHYNKKFASTALFKAAKAIPELEKRALESDKGESQLEEDLDRLRDNLKTIFTCVQDILITIDPTKQKI